MNQTNANVSVVRLGQTQGDTDNGDITLTVDPPPCVSTTASQIGNITTTETTTLVDPFLEMDPEQIERLKDALRSEEAKQLLGENATAMFGMLVIQSKQWN